MYNNFLLSNPLFNAYQGSDLFGKAIFLSLLILSIVTWILFFGKFLIQKKVQRLGIQFQEIFRKKENSPLSIDPKQKPHPYSHLFQILKENTLVLLNKNKMGVKENHPVTLSSSDIDLIQMQLMRTVSLETQSLRKNLFVLSTIVSLAPFLGLLGTVWGILLTFAQLQTGASIHANAAIMGGLAMALGTTVLGLVVAIPALIAYNYLKSSMHHFSESMEDFSHLMLTQVELHYRQVDI